MWSMRSFVVVAGSALVLAGAAAGAAQTGARSQADQVVSRTPTHYIYQGEPIYLELDRERLAVCYSDQSTEAERSSSWKTAGVGIRSHRPTGVREWHLLELDATLADLADADFRIRQLLGSPAVEFASPVFISEHGGWVIVTPDLLVRFESEHAKNGNDLLTVLAADLDVLERGFGAMTGAYKLRSHARNGIDVLNRASELAADPRVKWAEPDIQCSILRASGEYGNPPPDRTQVSPPVTRDLAHGPNTASLSSALFPNDPLFPEQWALRSTGQFQGTPGYDMDADLAWDITTGSPTIKVLILDDGIQQDHPDINQLPGMNFASDFDIDGSGGHIGECQGHGTHVAGCVSAIINNATGVVGVAPDCMVISARWLQQDPDCEYLIAEASWYVAALTWGEAQGAQITNNSWVGFSSSDAIRDKLSETYTNGMIHFGGAGNDGNSFVLYPARHDSVNAVSALAPDGIKAWWSNYGADLAFCAPGEDIYTTDRTGPSGDPGDINLGLGTSLATPYAAGVAALILSVDPTLTPPEVEERLRCSARDLGDPGWDNWYGHGLVNAYRALLPYDQDTDVDGVNDPCDNCPTDHNTDQADLDHDGVGDVCDNCPNDYFDDRDMDGLCGDVDNCPTIANPGQEDADGDGIGDACECLDPNYIWTGEGLEDYFGFDLGDAGDVNGDGFDDVIVGRWYEAGNTDPCAAYVYSGVDGSLLHTVSGENNGDWFGYGVSGVGDLDGDECDDFAVGALSNDAAGSGAGRCYVFSGADLDTLYVWDGPGALYNLGASVAGIGDVDNDTVPDIIVGAVQFYGGGPGWAYVYSGKTGAVLQSFSGEVSSSFFGAEVAAAGDVNNDEVPDFLVGASGHYAVGSYPGKVYVYSGADWSLLHSFDGEAANDFFGFAAAGAGDVDADGYDDIIIGAAYNDAGGVEAGRVYVFSGQTGDTLQVFTGSSANQVGWSVAGVGDINQDGYADYAIGAAGLNGAYVYSGQTHEVMSIYSGENPGDMFGSAICGATDCDGDGANDLVVGALKAGGSEQGRAYVYFLGDADADGMLAGCDNCRTEYNPTQTDADADNIGDLCDNCPSDYNPDQADTNGNSIGDICECACPCHGDPQCDGASDVLDVVNAVNVAFRNAVPNTDPRCPYEQTDVSCDGVTNVIDVVKFVNVAFRGGDAAVQFCDPCTP